MKKKNRLLSAILAVFVFFAVSISALAIKGGYDMTSEERTVGTGKFFAELATPSNYTSSGHQDPEENTSTKGFKYFELQDPLDASKQIDFSFLFTGNSVLLPSAGAIQLHTDDGSAVLEEISRARYFNHITLYDDISLSDDHSVNDSLVWDSHLVDQTAECSKLSFHVDPNKLEPAHTYYLRIDDTTYSNATYKLKEDGIYRFETKAKASGQEVVAGDISTSSGASFALTATYVSKDATRTDTNIINDHDKGYYLIDGEIPYQGSLVFDLTMTPNSQKKMSHLVAYVCESGNTETKLQEFDIANDTETKIENEILAVDSTKLETGKTYNLVFDKMSQSGPTVFDEDVVFEFNTHTHASQKIPGKAPNCEATGLTDGAQCSICGEPLVQQEVIPALGHDWIDMPAKDPTCTEAGKLPYQQCSRCKQLINYFTDETKPALGHVPKVTKEGTVTCTEAGLCDEIICERCNQTLQLQKQVEALGHDFVDGICTRCGETVELIDYSESDWQGNSISIHWTTPKEDDVKTKGLLRDSEGNAYYYNEFSSPFCANTNQTFAFDVKGQGGNHIGKEGNESPAKHIFVYSDESLSADSLVASADKGNITEVKRADSPATSEGMSNIMFTIASGALENDKTYYVVIDDKLESNQGRVIGTKVINKISTSHGDLEEIPAFKPTCTEIGREAGTMCKDCRSYVSGGKEIPALGHKEEAVKGKAATCTEKGLTDGKKCSVCDAVLEEQEEIPALGHDFKDGKCTRCDAADPDYKPTPVEPVSKFTGLANEADKDGNWWYYTDGKIDKNHTGVDQNKYGWWRVENGKVNFKAQGIYKNAYGWWKTTDGEVTFKENSIYQNEYGWWKCKDSKVDFNAQSIYQNQYGWWKTTDGKVTFKENGLFKNQYGTWKVENSKVNFSYNGTYQGKTIKNGKVQ